MDTLDVLDTTLVIKSTHFFLNIAVNIVLYIYCIISIRTWNIVETVNCSGKCFERTLNEQEEYNFL